MMVLRAVLRVISYRQLGNQFTFQLAVRKEHKLVTTGLYSVVRHPSYVGALMVIYGAAICQMGSEYHWRVPGLTESALGRLISVVYWLCIAYVSVGAIIRTRQEDSVLRAEFGQQWEGWASRTRFRLLPPIY